MQYRGDMRAARFRLAGLDRRYLHAPMCGTIEYAEHGAGTALLFSHPLFGGCDAGLGLAQTYAGDGFRVIAPSRFGYLGSTLPADASPAAQADAYALLLDAIGVDQAVVFGYSAGGPSTIQFALRHPDRTTALVFMASALPGRSSRPAKPLMQLVTGSDFAFWALRRYLTGQLDRLFVAEDLLLTAEQRATLRQTEAQMQPVRPRRHGVLFDLYLSNPVVRAFPLEEIAVPTLIINAEDDPLSAFDNAAQAATCIRGAKLLTIATGGHLLLGSEARIREQVAALAAVHTASSSGTSRSWTEAAT